MEDKRNMLADYFDQRITITGIIDKYHLVCLGVKDVRTALLQDVYAEVDGKQIDLGHVWLQLADPLKKMNLGCGDRIRCVCRVGQYKKRLTTPNKEGLMLVTKYNLSWPNEIEVIGRAAKAEVAPSSTPTSATPPNDQSPLTTIDLILEVKQIAQKAGGLDALVKLIGALRP